MVGAGAVVTSDVPPMAIVAGNPARIVGYDGAGSLSAGAVSTIPAEVGVSATRVAGVTLHRLPHVHDMRGNLSFGEIGNQIPFEVKRYFLVYSVASKEIRGEHAHRSLHQFLICVHGRCHVVADDGTNRQEFVLDSPTIGLHLPPMVWGIQYKYTEDAVMLVLASDKYDPASYIRDYSEFLELVKAARYAGVVDELPGHPGLQERGEPRPPAGRTGEARGRALPGEFEVVFVVDGSPDRCLQILRERLPALPLRTQLLSLSRNFGSFAAIAAGLESAHGDCMAVMAADLQEPPELVLQFFEVLGAGRADIVFGVRGGRSDPWLSELASNLFWFIYRKLVIKDMPRGGVDVFGCTREVRDHLLHLQGIDTNLIALLFWLGYRREYIVYERQRAPGGQERLDIR